MSLTRPGLFLSRVVLSAISFTLWYTAARPVHEDAGTVYVGLLEDDRRQLDRLGRWDSTPVPGRTIAPAFEKIGDEWTPVVNLNRKVTWTVAFDGKTLGKVESEPILKAALANITGPTDIHSIITPAKEIPVVGKREGRFSGSSGKFVRRPLVVVSKPNFSDPDEWKPRSIPNGVLDEVRSSFHTTFKHLRQCDASGEALKEDWSIPASEIVVSKSYGSTKHQYIVEIRVLHRKCLFNVDGEDFQSMGGNQIFFVSPDNKAAFLGLQWELVDAGDYDGDGKSEVIFQVAEGKDIDIETEGYVLFYDDFRRSVRFVWQNH
jgi:hypothetical protein